MSRLFSLGSLCVVCVLVISGCSFLLGSNVTEGQCPGAAKECATIEAVKKSAEIEIKFAGKGKGTVTSTPSGINCHNDCEATYALNTVVTLTATPKVGSAFGGWGGDCNVAGVVTMSTHRRCTATFNIGAAAPTLYWGNLNDNTIHSCTIGGSPCTSTTIANNATSGVSQPEGLQVVGSTLYWANLIDHTIHSCTIGGSPCTSTIIADNAASGVYSPRGLQVVGSTLYWANNGDHTIRSCTIGGSPCTSTIIANNATSGVYYPFGLQVVGSTLYWANLGDSTIRSCPIGGSPCTSTIIADGGTSGANFPFGLFIAP